MSNLWDDVAKETGYARDDCRLTFYKTIYGIEKLSVKQATIQEEVQRQLYRKGGIGVLLKGIKNDKERVVHQ